MVRSFVGLALAAQLACAGIAHADEGSKPPVEEAMAKIVALGPGVHAIVKNKKGHIVSCMVVAQARISTALGKAKGMELARDKANLSCSAEFVKWLKEEVTVYQSNDEETVTLIEGTEGGEDESLKESGKSVEKSSKKMDSVSKGLVRGLQVLHKDVDGDGKTYTLVKGWNAGTAEGVKKVAKDLASDEPGAKATKSSKKKTDKDIESGSATSDDAGDFLPKKK